MATTATDDAVARIPAKRAMTSLDTAALAARLDTIQQRFAANVSHYGNRQSMTVLVFEFGSLLTLLFGCRRRCHCPILGGRVGWGKYGAMLMWGKSANAFVVLYTCFWGFCFLVCLQSAKTWLGVQDVPAGATVSLTPLVIQSQGSAPMDVNQDSNGFMESVRWVSVV